MVKHNHAFYKRSLFVLLPFVTLWFFACTSSGKTIGLSKYESGDLKIEKPNDGIVPGGLFLVSVESASPIQSIHGEFQNHQISFYPNKNKYSALVGVEYATPAGEVAFTLTIQQASGTEKTELPIVIKAKEFASEALQVPPRTIAPTKKDLVQIKRDIAALKTVYARRTPEQFWDPPALLPVENIITSQYGTFRVYNRHKLNPHLGTDFRAPSGTPVIAPMSGYVALARKLFFTGYTVILDHGYGLFTVYGHLSELKAKEGRPLKKGELLGLSGATGRASGPHLHWGVNLHGTKIDPVEMIQLLQMAQK